MVSIECCQCKKVPISNDDIFFDMAISSTGKDVERIDSVICGSCLELSSVSTLNLLRRIENPWL